MKSFVILSLFVTAALAVPLEREDRDESFEGIEKRIIGGEIAKPGQFPYQARLKVKQLKWWGGAVTSSCGASLISDRVLLTAAHCVEMMTSGTVYLGSTTIQENEPRSIQIPIWHGYVITHEGWSAEKYINDIALIVLPEAVELNDSIQPVKLPKGSDGDFVGRIGIISGFGATESKKSSEELRYVHRQILNSVQCQYEYPNKIKESHVCVDGSQKKSACAGDSGGPLVVEDADGTRTLVGLTSFGSMSCDYGSPTVYTRISSYLEWINKHTGIPIEH